MRSFGLGLLFWAGFVILSGQGHELGFPQLSLVRPLRLLQRPHGLDVAVAHQASYYNPFLDIPFYWLATHTHAWFALGVLGAVQGANVVPLYLMAVRATGLRHRRTARSARRRWRCWAMTGALTLTMFGTTYYDNVMSVFMLSGLAILVLKRDALREGPLGKGGGPVGARRASHRHARSA